jgi:hypothetical protein
MSLLSLCNKTIDIDRPVITKTTHGGQSRAYSPLYSNIPACKQPVSGRMRHVAAKQGFEISHTWYTPNTVTLKAGDRITEGSDHFQVLWFEDQAGKGSVYAIHTLQIN